MSVAVRRAEPTDADFLLELLRDEDTEPYLGRRGWTREDVLADVERSRREPEEFGWYVFEVGGDRAGCVWFRRTNERNRIAEAGRFAVHPSFRGRGVGVEAARAFQRHLLRELGFHRIEIQVYAFNERAIAHAERSGYVREGTKRRAYLRNGQWVDAVLFSLLEEDLDG
ncbi:MAG TPA: GNAT family protein [Gaiellaceae bacterium]|nr:GNAT family protein [Gaiellaceae bacterium]